MVRAASPDDASAIARVHVATWRTAYAGLLPEKFLASLNEEAYEERWRRMLHAPGGRAYVAEQDGAVMGFASCGRDRAGEADFSGELYAIYVLAEAQRHGHGRELVRAVVAGLRELGLEDMIVWVLKDNAPARRFYERLGGVYVREQPINIDATLLREVGYGWKRLEDVLA